MYKDLTLAIDAKTDVKEVIKQALVDMIKSGEVVLEYTDCMQGHDLVVYIDGKHIKQNLGGE